MKQDGSNILITEHTYYKGI